MRRRLRGRSQHLSLSATDADWEMVRTKAKRRGRSMARYVLWLVERDAQAEAPDAAEWREVLDAARALPARLAGDADASSLIESMARGVGAMVDAWALRMLREGRRDALCAILAARMGTEACGRFVARIEALAAPGTASPARKAAGESTTPPGQGALFG